MGCCCGSLQDEACGWPRGTVRATIALTIVILAFLISGAVIILLIIDGKITEAVAVLGLDFTVVGSVTAYYFSAQSSAAATKAITESAQRVADSKDAEINRLHDTHERMLSRGLPRRKKKVVHEPLLDNVLEDDNQGSDPVVIVE